MTDTELRRLAESNIGIADVPLAPDVVLGLLDRIKALEVERDARPAITVADAIAVCAPNFSDLDGFMAANERITKAIEDHAAKGME